MFFRVIAWYPRSPLEYAAMQFSPARLRAKRDEAGCTRSLLAEQAMLAPDTIRAYEKGRKNPSAAALGRLAAALNCEVGDFYVQLADSEVA